MCHIRMRVCVCVCAHAHMSEEYIEYFPLLLSAFFPLRLSIYLAWYSSFTTVIAVAAIIINVIIGLAA